MILKILLPILLLASDDVVLVSAFLRAAPSSPSTTTTATRRPHHNHHYRRHHWIVAAPSHASTTDDDEDIGGSLSESGSGGGRRRGDNAAMSFLRKMGRVGGAANMDFANALGLDESPSGGTKTAHHEGGFKVSLSPRDDTAISDAACSPRPPLPFLERCRHFSIVPSSISTPVAWDHPPPQNVRKSKASYVPCAISGIIDDMSDPFPFTSSGSQWQGITDRVMGGSSNGSLSREIVDGRIANVLRGTVSLENGGGFVQMATDLSSDPSGAEGVFVDASGYDGVELDVYCEGMEDDEERFNVQ